MFVQDDVILNVDFFSKKGGVQTAACTTIATSHHKPRCLAVDHVSVEQTGSEETKVNKEIMFWPFVVNAVLKTRQIFSRK